MGNILDFDKASSYKREPDIWGLMPKKKPHKIDIDFIGNLESPGGEYITDAYVPTEEGEVLGKSGVTFGRGIDLGSKDSEYFKNLEIKESVITELKPYFGLKGQKAKDYLEANPLELDEDTVKTIDKSVKNDLFDKYIDYYEEKTGRRFSNLPKNTQTVIGSVVTQYGSDLEKETPKFNKAILANDKDAMVKELRNFGDEYKTRRNKEADLLEDKKKDQQSSLSDLFMPSAQAATETKPPEETISSVEPGNLRKFVEANVPKATRRMYASGSLADNIALGTMAAGKKTIEALYWPWRRMIEIPYSEIGTAIQERRSLGELGQATKRAAKSMMLWRKLEGDPKGYEDVAQNYWEAFNPNTEAPGWYKGMFSLGAAITLGHVATKTVAGAYKGVKGLAKKGLTRPATLEETKVMQSTMGAAGRKQLRKWGIRPQDLSDKGAVITTNKGEIRLSPDAVKLIKGKPVRVPKGVVLKKSKVAGYDPFEKVSFYDDPFVAPAAGGKVHPPMPAPEWRSKLIETVGQLKQPKVSGQQLMNIINKAVPAAEISASNIEKFLAGEGKELHKPKRPLEDALGTKDPEEIRLRKSWLNYQLNKAGLKLEDMVMPHGEWSFQQTTWDAKGNSVLAQNLSMDEWAAHTQETIEVAKDLKASQPKVRKFTKKEVIKYLEDNIPKINEVIKTGKYKPTEQERKATAEALEGNLGRPPTEEELDEAMADYVEEHGVPPGAAGEGTKFHQYTVPGGKNYRELLLQSGYQKPNLTLKEDQYGIAILANGVESDYELIRNPDGTFTPAKMGNPWGEKYNTRGEALKAVEEEYEPKDAVRDKQAFATSHWDEPNVLAHIRMDDRTIEGKKILFLEEIQSDWAAKVREKGIKKYYSREEVANFKVHDSGQEYWNVYDGNENLLASPPKNLNPDPQDALKVVQNQAKAGNIKFGAVPYHPLLKKWQELTLKKALRIAAEEGYDGIAWTTGQQQADRYGLSKQVDRIGWFRDPSAGEGFKTMNIVPKQGTQIALIFNDEGIVTSSSSKELKGKKLSDVVGKDIAEQALLHEEANLSGLDLKVGGRWAKNLYDKQIPSILKKLTKVKPEKMYIQGKKFQVMIRKYKNKYEYEIREKTDGGYQIIGSKTGVEEKDLQEFLDDDIHKEVTTDFQGKGAEQPMQKTYERTEDIGQQFLPIDENLREKLIMDGQYLFSKSATSHAVITDREEMIRLNENITVEDSAGNKVKLLKGQEYTIYRLSTGAAKIQDGRQVTLWEGELDKLKAAGIELRWPNAPMAGGKMHEQNKQISNSAKKVQEEMQRVDAELEGKRLMQDSLWELKMERSQYKNSIRAYEKGYLKEELAELPSYYKTKSGDTTIDKAAQEAGFEDGMEMRDYLKDLDEQIKELQTEIESIPQPKKITKTQKTYLKRRAKDLQIGRKKGAINARENLKNVQTKLKKFIKGMDLPPNEKNGLIARVTNVETLRQLAGRRAETIQKIADLMKEYSAKTEIKKMVKDIQKLPTKNLPLDYKEKIRELKKGLDLKRRTGRTIARRNSMKEFVGRMKEQGEEIRIPQERLDELEKITLNDMTVEDLRNVHSILIRLYHHGKLKNKLLTSRDKRNFQAIVEAGVKNITKGEGLEKQDKIIEILNENKSLREKSIQKKREYIAEHLRPERIANMLDGWIAGLNTQHIFKPIADADMQRMVAMDKAFDKVQAINKSLLKPENVTEKHNIGRFKGMAKDQAFFVYANSLNPHNRMILYNTGFKDKDINDITNFLSNEEKEAIHNMLQYYDETQWASVNEVYSDLNGENMGKRVNYFPVQSLEEASALEAIEMDILQRHYARRAGVSKGFTKETVTHKKGFDKLSYLENVYKNLRDVEYYKAFAKPVRDVSKYLRNPKVKAAIQQKYGKEIYRELDKWIKDVSFGKNKPATTMIDKAARFLRLNFVVSVLGFNLSVGLKQSISFMEAVHYMNLAQGSRSCAFKGLAKTIGEGYKKGTQFVEEKSPLIKYRRFRQERELQEILAQRTGLEQLGLHPGIGTKVRKARESAMLPIMMIDKLTVTCIWRGAYDSVLETGKLRGVEIDPQNIEEEAVNFANEVIRKTQPMGGLVHLAGVFRGPEYQKMFTMFKNQLNQNYNLWYEFYKDAGGEEAFGMKFKKWVETGLMWTVFPALIYGMATRKRLPTLKEFMLDMATTTFGSLIILNLALRTWGDTTPIDAIITELWDTYNASGWGEKAENLASAASKASGIPYNAIKRFITGRIFGPRWSKPGEGKGGEFKLNTGRKGKTSKSYKLKF